MRSNAAEKSRSGYSLNKKLQKDSLLQMDLKNGTLSEKSLRSKTGGLSRQGSRAGSRKSGE